MPGAAKRGQRAPAHTGKLDSVQLLRAAAATLVVLGHIMGAVTRMHAEGVRFVRPDLATGAGVDLFFLISGFIMVVSSGPMFAAADGPRDFLLRRLVRIVPLYWGVTTLALVLAMAGRHHALPGLRAIAASYGFIPYDTTGRHDGFAFPIVDLGWTLNYEMLFYVLFASAMRAGRERCVLMVTIALLAMIALGALWPPRAVALQFWTQPIMLEFAAGMGLGLLFVRGRLALPGAARMALAAAAGAALLWNPFPALNLPVTPTPNGMERLVGWGLPAAALLAAAISGPLTIRSRLGRMAVVVGDASYALYLVHPFWLPVYYRAFPSLPAPLCNAWVLIAMALAGAIVAAVAVHLRIERPLIRRLTGLLRRRGAPIHAVPLVDATGGDVPPSR